MKYCLKILCFTLIAVFIVACAGTETRQSTGQYLDSSVITAKVKTGLIQSPVVEGLAIDVETYRGTVQLSGFVDTENQRKEAGRIAKSVEGVVKVENDIKVKNKS